MNRELSRSWSSSRRPLDALWTTNVLSDLVESLLSPESPVTVPLSRRSFTTDVWEDDRDYVIEMDVPGMQSSDLRVSVENNTLRVSGERTNTVRNAHLTERTFGSVSRSLLLPKNTRPDALTARCQNGVLTVRVPKTEASNPSTFDVTVE